MSGYTEIALLQYELEKLRAERSALRAENESMKRDAERYRFIKDKPWCDNVADVICSHQNAAWDNVIDAAMAQVREGGGVR